MTNVLSAAELAEMRTTVQQLMPESWSLVHPTDVVDAQGNTQTWAVTASGSLADGTGARLMSAGYQASEAIIAARPGAVSAWTITLPHGTPVDVRDRVIIGTKLAVAAVVADFSAYRVFEVVGEQTPHSYEAAVRAYAVEVS